MKAWLVFMLNLFWLDWNPAVVFCRKVGVHGPLKIIPQFPRGSLDPRFRTADIKHDKGNRQGRGEGMEAGVKGDLPESDSVSICVQKRNGHMLVTRCPLPGSLKHARPCLFVSASITYS